METGSAFNCWMDGNRRQARFEAITSKQDLRLSAIEMHGRQGELYMQAHDLRSDVRDARGHENNKMRAQVRSDVQIKRLVSSHKIKFYVTMLVI